MSCLAGRLLSVSRSALAPIVRNIWTSSVSILGPRCQPLPSSQSLSGVVSRYFSSYITMSPCSTPSPLLSHGGCSPLLLPPARGKHLILIRRAKMKKHKKKKALKRLRFVIAKKKYQKTTMKEKVFQAEQFAVIAEARAFDARQYVDKLLEQNSTAPLSTIYRGKRLPYFCNVQKLPKYTKLEPLEKDTS